MLEKIEKEIYAWMDKRANNAIEPGSEEAAFDRPLIGVASGGDPLFCFLKHDIGKDFYWTPTDAFRQGLDIEVAPEELSVISWVLPQTTATKLAHRKMKDLPSIEWSRARHYGEKVNENLRRHMVEFFVREGIGVVAPTLLPSWGGAISEQYGFASSWSERHAAYVCGLGTFGLSDGLITSVGKAIRVGSVIVHNSLPVTPRPYINHTAHCLLHSGKKCTGCIRRCPVGAISEAGHDKVKCKKYIREVTAQYVKNEQLGFAVNSCGLCQTGVPCESRNPMTKFL